MEEPKGSKRMLGHMKDTKYITDSYEDEEES